MRLIEGQLIHHRYRLDHRIAKGGMGEVWKGYDLELGRPVAIKAVRSDYATDHTRLARLRAEAHNSANLAHPNIAALFEYYEHDGTGFIIMEYVPSDSLAKIYKQTGRMSPERLLPILIQVARGLYVAHRHGVIHRDVKPGNIMVGANGDVKITDFGVSYSTNQEQITQAGMVVGTAQYISPEQAQGEQATPQSDIYSLGVVAYEGLAGHRPFTGATPVDIAAAQVNDPVPPLPDDVDPELRDYVMGMLAKDPAKRPRSALEVSQALGRIERRILEEDSRRNQDEEDQSGAPGTREAKEPATHAVPLAQISQMAQRNQDRASDRPSAHVSGRTPRTPGHPSGRAYGVPTPMDAMPLSLLSDPISTNPFVTDDSPDTPSPFTHPTSTVPRKPPTLPPVAARAADQTPGQTLDQAPQSPQSPQPAQQPLPWPVLGQGRRQRTASHAADRTTGRVIRSAPHRIQYHIHSPQSQWSPIPRWPQRQDRHDRQGRQTWHPQAQHGQSPHQEPEGGYGRGTEPPQQPHPSAQFQTQTNNYERERTHGRTSGHMSEHAYDRAHEPEHAKWHRPKDDGDGRHPFGTNFDTNKEGEGSR